MTIYANKNEAVPKVLIVLKSDSLLLLPLYDHNSSHSRSRTAKFRILVSHYALAPLASLDQQFQNRGVVNVGHALDSTDRASLDHKFQDVLSRVQIRVHPFESLARFAEGGLALLALIALRAVTVCAESPGFGAAIVARHFGPCLSSGFWSKMAVGLSNPAFAASPRLSPADTSTYQRGEYSGLGTGSGNIRLTGLRFLFVVLFTIVLRLFFFRGFLG
jgi:hypothetical protein